MTLESVSEWLKDTVPGIIILGVFGTFVAALIARIARRILAPGLARVLKRIVWRMSYVLTRSVAVQQTYLLLKQGDTKFLVYYTLQLMKLLFALYFSALSFIVLLYGLQQPADTFARPLVIVPMISFFLTLWWALRPLMSALVPYKLDLESLIRKSIDEIRKKGGDSNPEKHGAT